MGQGEQAGVSRISNAQGEGRESGWVGLGWIMGGMVHWCSAVHWWVG